MAPRPTIPLAFGALGLATLLVLSGLKGQTVADAFAGKGGSGFDPAAGLKSLENPVADQLTQNGVTGGNGSGVAGLAPPTFPGSGPSGSVIVDGHPVAGWIAPIVMCARRNGWRGRVTSGVRSDAEQAQACIHVCGNPHGCSGTCASPGTSNHRGTKFPLGAVDVEDPAGFDRAKAKCPNGGLLRNALPRDPVHRSFTGR